jgi:TolB-like protein
LRCPFNGAFVNEGNTPIKSKPPAVDRLSQLWARVNEYKIVQWSVAYVALAYGIQHGVVLTREAFEWPQLIERMSMLMLALGLPVVVTLAWYHGERASRHFTKAELSILSALLAIGSIVFYALVQPSEEVSSAAQSVAREADASAGYRPATQAEGISVAVLPFVNLSSDAEQEFFSDGITEEITSAIAKVPGLLVIGRTSAFEFKNKNKDLRAIGQALGTTHLIEGSVRKAGNRVRITAQLIVADTGVHVWTENYDRELTDIFAVQENIAQAIAGALRVPLGLKTGESLITSRIADPAIYERFLQLRSQMSQPALDLFEGFVARAPGFAPGWAILAGAYRAKAADSARSGDFKTAAFLTDKEELAAQKAIKLDPAYSGGYSELAAVQTRRGNWAEAEDLYKRALELDPTDSGLLNPYSQSLAAVGRLKDALRIRERLRTLEPLVNQRITARMLLADGQIDNGMRILEADMSTGLQRNVYLAEAYAVKGRFSDAADTLLRITGDLERSSVEAAARLLRAAPSRPARPVDVLEGELSFVFAYIGMRERVLEYPEKAAQEGNFATMQAAWRPSAASLRKTKRFKALMQKTRLVEYWRVRGWPDHCHPVMVNDFVCD